VSQVETHISELQSRSVTIAMDSTAIADVMERLDRYLTLSFDNYCESGVYAKEFSRTRSVASSRCAQTKVS